jgi:hypothetical protein
VRELTIKVSPEEVAHLANRHAFIAHYDEILDASHGSRLLNKLASAAYEADAQAFLAAHVAAASGEAAGTAIPLAVPAAGPPPSRGSQRHAGEARPLPGVGHQSSADPGPRVGDRMSRSCAECAGRAGSPSSGPSGADLSRPGAAVIIALWLIILAAAALAWLVLT